MGASARSHSTVSAASATATSIPASSVSPRSSVPEVLELAVERSIRIEAIGVGRRQVADDLGTVAPGREPGRRYSS